MKDKLYKTGHKKAYYRIRGALRAFGLSLAVALSLATPVLITYGVEQSRAEAVKQEQESEQTQEGSSEEALLSYCA